MKKSTQTLNSDRTISPNLLFWYDRHARKMPWRVDPHKRKAGILPDPYHVWLSEVMLQQTQVATVRDYFLKFVRKWPKIEDLANSDTEDVMKAWAGLGYYSRARNLKKCAELVANEFGGAFPQSHAQLLKFPGIGDYTASAICAIAFDQPEPVVDGNIERVVSRLFRLATPLPALKPLVREKMTHLTSQSRPGDFAQAMMDLGATICTPKNPACSLCPLRDDCEAFAKGDAVTYPIKAPKKQTPTRKGAAFVAVRGDGAVYLEKRVESGLLGGMTQVPTTDWNSNKDGSTQPDEAPFEGEWYKVGTIRHTFTHFHLELTVYQVDTEADAADGWWSAPDALTDEALPTVFKKVLAKALPDAGL